MSNKVKREFSPEHRAKLSDAQKGRIISPEHRAKIGASHRGMKHKPASPERRAKISTALKGRKWLPERIHKMKGKKLPPEHLAKLVGRKLSPEHIANLKRSKTPELRAKISAALKGKNKTKKIVKLKKIKIRLCAHCHQKLVQRHKKYCDECRVECHSIRMQPKLRQTKPCLDCGTLITGTKSLLRCNVCQKKRGKELGFEKHGRVNKHRHRARKYGVIYEPINPLQVLERDGWRCQLCGIKTPKELRGLNKPNAPEIDHILPMSLGGAHSWNNVQCACRHCNMTKGAKPKGQMQLFSRPSF